jgi:CheY-like chemotaxis protein
MGGVIMDASNRPDPKPLVLIVDDEPLVRMTIADMLRLGGFEVLEAGAGAQALQLLAACEQPVAAVVSDVRMPGIDGVDLSHRVRSAHPQMPIVLVSGEANPDPALLPAGARFLRKPARLRDLIAAVFQAMADPHVVTSPKSA